MGSEIIEIMGSASLIYQPNQKTPDPALHYMEPFQEP